MSSPVHQLTHEELKLATQQPGAGVGAGVAIAVLSQDQALVGALNEVVTADHTLALCNDAVGHAEQIVAIGAGVALVDADALSGNPTSGLIALRKQFPDLVLIAAGKAEHQSSVAGLLTDGTVYRFLHKPVSQQRVRLFVEAALRRFDELRAQSAAVAAAQATTSATPKLIRTQLPANKLPWAIGAAAVVALGFWAVLRDGTETPNPGPSATAPVTAPAGTTNTSAPQPVATATLPTDQKNKLDALLNRAERALAERQIDTAVALLRDAGTIQADNARLAYLTAQVLKERERALLARARSAAADGDFDRALSVLESAGSSTDVADTRRVVTQQQVDERVRNSLRLVQERLTRGALIEPTNDSARFHALSARSLAPRDAAVIRAVENVRTRILNEARAAAQRGDSAIVDRLLSVAREDGAENSTLETIRSALRESRNNLRSAELTRLAGLVTQRISQNQLLEPEGDSAQHWFNQLRELENDGAVTANSRVNLNSRLLARGSEALGRGEYDATQRLLRGAEAVAGRTRESSALQEALSAQQEKDRLAKSVVGANSLKRTRFVEPVFPSAAVAQNIGGWVDLEFSVMPDGTVNRVQVLNANPAGVFDDAARIAVGKWRFEPVRRDGTAVEQRARLRMRFSPPD